MKVVTRNEWDAKVVKEERAMFIFCCEFVETKTNKQIKDICDEFASGFWSPLMDKMVGGDVVMASFDFSSNDAPEVPGLSDLPALVFIPKGQGSTPEIFPEIKDIGLGGTGNPLEGAVHKSKVLDWAREQASGGVTSGASGQKDEL